MNYRVLRKVNPIKKVNPVFYQYEVMIIKKTNGSNGIIDVHEDPK